MKRSRDSTRTARAADRECWLGHWAVRRLTHRFARRSACQLPEWQKTLADGGLNERFLPLLPMRGGFRSLTAVSASIFRHSRPLVAVFAH